MVMIFVIISLLIGSCADNDQEPLIINQQPTLHLDILESSDTSLTWRLAITNNSDVPIVFPVPQLQRGVRFHAYQLLVTGDQAELIDWISEDGRIGTMDRSYRLDSTDSIMLPPGSVYTTTQSLPVRETSLRYKTGPAEMYVTMWYAVGSFQTQMPSRMSFTSNSQPINLGSIHKL